MTVRHDPGLAANPRVWHRLEVERDGSRAPLLVPCVPPRKRRRAKYGDNSAQSVSRHAVTRRSNPKETRVCSAPIAPAQLDFPAPHQGPGKTKGREPRPPPGLAETNPCARHPEPRRRAYRDGETTREVEALLVRMHREGLDTACFATDEGTSFSVMFASQVASRPVGPFGSEAARAGLPATPVSNSGETVI